MEDVDGAAEAPGGGVDPQETGEGREARAASPASAKREDSGNNNSAEGAALGGGPFASCPCLDSRPQLDGWEAGRGARRDGRGWIAHRDRGHEAVGHRHLQPQVARLLDLPSPTRESRERRAPRRPRARRAAPTDPAPRPPTAS